MRCFLTLALLVTFFSFVVSVVSIAIPYWLYGDKSYVSYQGLWQRCDKQVNQCIIIKLPRMFLDAVRVFMLFGMFFYLFATICTFMYMCVKKEKTSLVTAASIFTVIGGLSCTIAIIIYGSMYEGLLRAENQQLHAGFALAVTCTISGFVSTMIYCMAKVRDEID